ncbi:MAG: hypothetical protein WC073_11425 [Sterolibacterium sp.]
MDDNTEGLSQDQLDWFNSDKGQEYLTSAGIDTSDPAIQEIMYGAGQASGFFAEGSLKLSDELSAPSDATPAEGAQSFAPLGGIKTTPEQLNSGSKGPLDSLMGWFDKAKPDTKVSIITGLLSGMFNYGQKQQVADAATKNADTSASKVASDNAFRNQQLANASGLIGSNLGKSGYKPQYQDLLATRRTRGV